MKLKQPRFLRHRRHLRPGLRRLGWLGGFAVAAVLALGGCGSQTRHELLSFFFDGVPHPDSTATEETVGLTGSGDDPGQMSDLEQSSAVPVLYVHPPYEDKGCDNCHLMEGNDRFAQTVTLIVPERQLCYECHDDMMPEELRKEFPWVHGPVAAGLCTGCHSPHRSTHPFYLHAEPGRDLCLRCHDGARLADLKAHAEEFDACLQCHDAHAGEARADLVSLPGAVPGALPESGAVR